MDWSSLSKYDQFFSHVGVDVKTISKCDASSQDGLRLFLGALLQRMRGVFEFMVCLCHISMGIVGHPCRITRGCMEPKKFWNVDGALVILDLSDAYFGR